ncbi:bifunctional heptose 7-phosphate kinase/heptose 1-phosphate adenyltransferase [Parablautia muri]|nr:bifunctional ADP-heptose synthase [Parablautia muri]
MSGWRELYKKTVMREFAHKKALIIGDLMVDEYITGMVCRISPEAPVPILDFEERRLEAGGASNVAHNIRCLGAETAVAGTAAEDEMGNWLRNHFQEMGIATQGMIAEVGRTTTVKTRYATKGQQLLRIDNEDDREIADSTKEKIYGYLVKMISTLDLVVLSDYKKGVLNDAGFVQRIIKLCRKYHVLISIDSKSRNISAFENADFVKPNNQELAEAVGIRIEDDKALNLAGKKYLEESGARALVVTRGSKGISVFTASGGRKDYTAKDVQVYDVCGAGDTVISAISLALVSGLAIADAVKLANLAAGVVITRIGTVAVTPEELVRSIDEE